MHNLTGKVDKLDEHRFAGGGFADVWRGTWTNPPASEYSRSQIVAVKVIRGSACKPNSPKRWNFWSLSESPLPRFDPLLRQKLIREGKVWCKLQHPSITPFLGVSYDFSLPGEPCLVCPYYKNGNLADWLLQVPNADRYKLSVQVAEGISYLHSFKPKGVIHGDIKATNILINDNGDASLTDFGLSRVLESSGFTTTNLAGSCRWMAPELIPLPGDIVLPKITAATDTWAFGMTLIEIMTGLIPFDETKHDTSVILTITQGGLPQRDHYPAIHDAVWELMQQCWNRDPSKRSSIHDIALALRALREAETACHPTCTLDLSPSLTTAITPREGERDTHSEARMRRVFTPEPNAVQMPSSHQGNIIDLAVYEDHFRGRHLDAQGCLCLFISNTTQLCAGRCPELRDAVDLLNKLQETVSRVKAFINDNSSIQTRDMIPQVGEGYNNTSVDKMRPMRNFLTAPELYSLRESNSEFDRRLEPHEHGQSCGTPTGVDREANCSVHSTLALDQFRCQHQRVTYRHTLPLAGRLRSSLWPSNLRRLAGQRSSPLPALMTSHLSHEIPSRPSRFPTCS